MNIRVNSGSLTIASFLSFLLLAAVFLGATITPVSATYTETAYSYSAEWKWFPNDPIPHMLVGFLVPRDTLAFNLKTPSKYRPYVGGISITALSLMKDHTNPQEWEYYSRTQFNTKYDIVKLTVPKSYVGWCTTIGYQWQYKIYIKYYRP